MASAKMPGASVKSATSVPASKKQDHLEAGRRKLEEYRKRKAEEKRVGDRSNSADKPIANDGHVEGIFANGSDCGPKIEGNDSKETHVVSHSSSAGVNGLDAAPVSGLKEDKANGLPQNFRLERASGTESDVTTGIAQGGLPVFPGNIPTLLEGDLVGKLSQEDSDIRLLTSKTASQNFSGSVGIVHEQTPWMEGTQQAGSRSNLEVLENDLVRLASGSSTNLDSVLFKREESTGVVSDGPLHSRIVDNSWKRSSGDLPGLRHEFSMPLPSSKQRTDTPVLSLVSSIKDERAGSGREESVSQFRSSIMSNGMKPRNPKEPQFLLGQSKKLPSSDLGERESLFVPRLLDKPSFQPSSTLVPANRTASAAVSFTSDYKGGPSLSLSASDQSLADAFSDQEKGLKLVNQDEERKKDAENDDFTALEQHIDDLTQEKFSLQRALDAARSLAESLSQQNSVLTEDFNSQGAIINQLQEELAKKKEEVTAQSLVLSSLMMERERAQQENNSAVERSQILAGEVIALEEKVLRLRSSELKLQRELETLKSDNDSFRLHSATLEKDRQSLRSMLEALQEDKKLLHSQLQKTLTSSDGLRTKNTKEVLQTDSRDASTSTDDLEVETQDRHTTGSVVQRHASGGPQLPETSDNSNEASSSIVVPSPHSLGSSVPPGLATLSVDDFRAINNIDVLITELISEKEALLETLKSESAKASEFQALNIELSKKLEAQTQRLELVVAQNMAHGGNAVATNSIEIEPQYTDYVDEGDEVVERVLGWIMRIFPGGSSRRQGSKLL
eukprot:c24748_g1_i1 orf=580-2943(-)